MHHTEGLVIDNCHNVIIVAMTLTQELRMSRKTIKHLHAAKDSLGQDSDPILSPDKEIQSVMMDFDGRLFGISQFALLNFNWYDILLNNMRLLVFGRTTI